MPGNPASEAGKVAFNNTGDLKVGTLTETDGNGNLVNNVTTLNVVMRESVPTAASLNGSLDQLKGLRTFGY